MAEIYKALADDTRLKIAYALLEEEELCVCDAANIVGATTATIFEKRKIDDPIYALSIHGAAGVWGTISTGFFAAPELATVGKPGLFYGGGIEQLGVQIMGAGVSGAYAFIVSFIILFAAKKLMGGLRVTEEEEIMGLDMSEHGSYGYPEVFLSKEDKISS
ncbi:ArsR family transcriptional regulator [Bacillus sp. F19]|nr:ArsR family transcriptional regulator [Bacillus sp. F19]